jgi:hypothetical protein
MEELKRLTRHEREEWVSKWRASGLSKAAFCRAHEIELRCFYNWSNPSGIRKKKGSSVGFQAIRSESGLSSLGLMIIQLPNGVQVKLPVLSEVDQVLSLLRGLGCN